MDFKEDIPLIYRIDSTFFEVFTNTFCPPCIFFKTRYNGWNPSKIKDSSRFYQHVLSYKPQMQSALLPTEAKMLFPVKAKSSVHNRSKIATPL